jgi:hypothetical protein
MGMCKFVMGICKFVMEMCMFVMGMCKFVMGMCKFVMGMCRFVMGMCKFVMEMCMFVMGMCKFVMGMCKSDVCLVFILCTCELDIHFSLFLATNKSIDGAYSNLSGFIEEIDNYNSFKKELKPFLPLHTFTRWKNLYLVGCLTVINFDYLILNLCTRNI